MVFPYNYNPSLINIFRLLIQISNESCRQATLINTCRRVSHPTQTQHCFFISDPLLHTSLSDLSLSLSTMSAREDASPIDEYPWRNLPTKLRSDIPRRKRIPHFSISATPVADHKEVVVLLAPAPVQSSSSTSCLQSQITSLDSYSNNHLSSFRSLTRKQPELGSAVDPAPVAKRLRREVVSETGSCLESVSETNAPVQIADSDEDCDEVLSDSSDWWFLSEDDITDSSQEDAVPSEMYAFFLQFTRQFIPFDNGRTKSKAPAVGSQDSKSEELRVSCNYSTITKRKVWLFYFRFINLSVVG